MIAEAPPFFMEGICSKLPVYSGAPPSSASPAEAASLREEYLVNAACCRY